MNKKHSIIIIMLSLFAIINFFVPIHAINNKEVIKVAFCPLEGFFEYDENGKECGYGVDYLNELARYANIEWKYVPIDSWEDIKNYMLDGRVDVQMPVSQPLVASSKYDYSIESILTTYHAIMTKNDRDDLYYQDYNTISKIKLGCSESLITNTTMSDHLKSIGIYDNIIYYNDYNSAKDALDRGEIDGVISNVMDLTSDMKILDKFSIVNNYITTIIGSPYYAVINNALTQMKLEEPSFEVELTKKYFPKYSNEPFTKEEIEYINSHNTINVGVFTDCNPVSYYNNKKFKGIAIDVANDLANLIGIKFNYVPIENNDPYKTLENNELIMPAKLNNDENKYFTTSPMFTSQIYLAVNHGNNIPKAGQTIGILKSTPGILKNIKELDKFDIIEYDNNQAALNALKNGSIAAFANNSHVINWLLENPRYANLSALRYQNIPLPYNIIGKNEDIILKSIINKAIRLLNEDDINKYIQKNTRFSVSDLSFIDTVFIYKNYIITISIVVIFILLVTYFYNLSRSKYIKKIEESNYQKDQANKIKSEFLARMSHDMRTPLNVIMGMTNLAIENNNPLDTNDCLDKINVSSEFLLGLINDVLDIEHMESTNMTLNLKPYSSLEFTNYMNAIIVPLCKQKSITFRYNYNGPKDLTIIQDKLRINQLYFNLLSNSIKFTPENGIITFDTNVEQLNNGKVRIIAKISDTGIGMSKEFIEHMFDPFTQENRVMKSLSEGTGLGLSIVKKICDLMNIKISVESEVNVGTTFTIDGIFEISNTPFVITNIKDKPINNESLINKTILVCEDHPLNQEIIKRLLEKKGIIVIIKDDGKKGVEAFKQSSLYSYDLILMDIRMPVLNGLDATKEIRALDRIDAKTIPIIALTANAYQEDIDNCLKSGMNAHLVKPINPEILYKVLTMYINN